MARTYIENQVIPHIPEEYSEDNLRKKFAKRENELWKEIEDNLEQYNQLKNIEGEGEDSGAYSWFHSKSELQSDLKLLRSQTNESRVKADGIKYETKLLDKYGQAFANLYYIKEQHEIKGYDEKLSFTEVDITGNGDIITDNQHYGMSFNPDGRLTQPALTVRVDDDLEFNVGMMEFNKPNSAPEVKLQISFDEDTAENLDAEKLNAIFDFCEKYGISSSDMIIRRFDGSIDEGAIQEKLNTLLAEREARKAAEEAKADREENEQQKSREKELVKEISEVARTYGAKLPKDLTLDEVIEQANKVLPNDKQLDREAISADVPTEDNILAAATKDDKQEKLSFKQAHLKSGTSAAKKQEVLNESTSLSDEAGNSQQSVAGENSQEAVSSVTVPQQNAPAPKAKEELTKMKVEQKFEEFFEEALSKRRNYSYFKTHTGLFGAGWTEYIIYDTEDRKNYRNDAREDKNGNVKYNYSFKFFIRQDSDGIHFAYRTPHHKPINEDIVGGIVGQLKDLGYTHVNFVKGISDKEKGIWRKALAEKGLVPIGMGLDRSKAEGMIKAAKEKLSSEEFSNFKYRLALQMNKRNKEKGKKVDKSEQDFIDGLLLARKYEAFANGYTEVLKGKITRLVHPPKEIENGAVVKIAAMANLRRLFNVFKDGVEQGGILNSEALSDKEKAIISEHPALLGNPSKFTGAHFAELYDIMFKESCDISKIELEKKFREPGAKRAHETIKKGEFNAAYNSCKSIIKELKALGVDEIDLPESTDRLPYNAPDLNKNASGKTIAAPTAPAPSPAPAPVAAAHSFERSDR